jgi:aryl-alcohol dehydrogenase-like predicted oxidoreductase
VGITPNCRAVAVERRLPPFTIVEHRRLGTSDLVISRIGLGTSAIGGGDWILGWGPQDVLQSIATIRRALDRGINWIDTSAVFGLGHAEAVIARALRDIPVDARPYIFTRCGLVWDELGNVSHDLRASSIRSQAEASLRRLRVDRVDLFEIGWTVWPAAPIVSGSLEEAWGAMAALQREGKARYIGISKSAQGPLARLDRISPITSITAPYSLLRRELEAYLHSLSDDQPLGVLACSTLGSGILTGAMTPERLARLPHNDWRRRHGFFREMALTQASRLIERLREVATRQGQPLGAVALAWALHHPQVTAAIVGARRPAQVDEIVRAASIELSVDDLFTLGRALHCRAAVTCVAH